MRLLNASLGLLALITLRGFYDSPPMAACGGATFFAVLAIKGVIEERSAPPPSR